MNATIEVDGELTEMLDDFFGTYAEANAERPAGLDRDLWAQLAELGLVRLTGDESTGGSGAGWAEAAALITAAAKHGVRAPLAEHDLLAGWFADALGTCGDGDGNSGSDPEAVRTIAILDESGRAAYVPWASAADRIVLVWPAAGGYRVCEVAAAEIGIEAGANAIGEPRDAIVANVATLSGTEISDGLVEQLRLRSALVRAVQVCAALDRALDLAAQHTSTRVQFGRPLSKFQVLQGALADMAAECALARAATEAALLRAVTTDWQADDLAFLVAVARSCAGHAATVVVRGSHQLHGAIGTTLEHPLHHATRAALAWRSEYGSLASWDERVLDIALQADTPLWETVAG